MVILLLFYTWKLCVCVCVYVRIKVRWDFVSANLNAKATTNNFRNATKHNKHKIKWMEHTNNAFLLWIECKWKRESLIFITPRYLANTIISPIRQSNAVTNKNDLLKSSTMTRAQFANFLHFAYFFHGFFVYFILFFFSFSCIQYSRINNR